MPTPDPLYQLIVIGSSAGGIEALSTLVASLPPSFPAPLVIAQHLDPTRPSHLGEILTRRSALPVETVEGHHAIQPGTLYVVPANRHVQITDHDITVLPDGAGRPKPSIDLLLSSAAEVYGDQLIAVILTGTGSDGSNGARVVHEAGGMVVIQNPSTAAYPGMPAAVAPQVVDIVADLESIGAILADLLAGTRVAALPEAEQDLGLLLDDVLEHSGIDFHAYKSATILRRLQRRIVATASGDLSAYRDYLQAHPEEYDLFVSNCLIKVTEFMRDPELFALLRSQILPELISYTREHNQELRIWSAGCATGEEAYSLAMLVSEALGEELERLDVRIFATDLDPAAVNFARRGVYQARSIASLPADLRQRYLTDGPEGFAVSKQIRSLVVFGEHDLGQRAPFPRIDLVLCRNVLIYFSKELQQRALQLFAFSLREGGYLALGHTETINPLLEFFVPVPASLKLYRRHGGGKPRPVLRLAQPATVTGKARGAPGPQQGTGRELLQLTQDIRHARTTRESLLLQLPIGVIVVDRRYDIAEINSAARRLLSIHGLAIGEDLVHLTPHIPSQLLRAAIDHTIQDGTVSTLEEIAVPHVTSGEPTYLQITCYPQRLAPDDAAVEHALILVADETARIAARREVEQTRLARQAQDTELLAATTDLARRVAELRQANSDLQAERRRMEEALTRHDGQMQHLVETNRVLLQANDELTRANAELRATGDSYLLTSEEAQSVIEEAETLNEELQASNEELETLNEELQATVEELHTSNSDLAARGEELQQIAVSLNDERLRSEHEREQLATILAGLADAVLVVAADGAALLTNAAYRDFFAGEGLRLVDDSERLLPADATPQARAARGETFRMTFSVTGPGGERRWCEALGQPLRGATGGPAGVVVIRDISERSLRRLEQQFVALANHELRTPLTTTRVALQLLERWLKRQANNEQPLQHLNMALAESKRLGRLVDDLMDVSRLQSGKLTVQLAPLRLDSLLIETVELGRSLSQRQEIVLDAGAEPVLINGDAQRLQQLVLNLLTNAMTHAAASPRIEVLMRHVDRLAEIQVRDSGAGIAADELGNLFSRFYQVTNGGVAGGSGLGLGLWICRQIAVAHGGTIAVHSTVGEGTTFTVQLPLADQAEQVLLS